MVASKKPPTFKVAMVELVRIGYMGAISSTVFVLINYNYPLGRRVLERELFSEADLKRMKKLKELIGGAKEGEMMEFTLQDYILLYTALELSCKLHVSGLSEELQEINRESIEKSDVPYTEVRDIMLRYTEAIMRIMTERAGRLPAFKERKALMQQPFWLTGE